MGILLGYPPDLILRSGLPPRYGYLLRQRNLRFPTMQTNLLVHTYLISTSGRRSYRKKTFYVLKTIGVQFGFITLTRRSKTPLFMKISCFSKITRKHRFSTFSKSMNEFKPQGETPYQKGSSLVCLSDRHNQTVLLGFTEDQKSAHKLFFTFFHFQV